MCPADGRVLHFGRVERGTGRVEQVKGVHYPLSSFLGPDSPAHHPTPAPTAQHTDLFHIVVYLAPGDYHHFHSPAEWTAQVRRHFHGEAVSESRACGSQASIVDTGCPSPQASC